MKTLAFIFAVLLTAPAWAAVIIVDANGTADYPTIQQAVDLADPNLVGWWRFDGDANDSSVYGNDGAVYGDPNWVIGVADGALDFDGVDDYIEIHDDDSLTPRDQITISFWLYNRGGQDAGIYKYAACPGENYSPGDSRAYVMAVGEVGNKIHLLIFSSTFDFDAVQSINAVPLMSWHHVAVTFHQGNASTYIDGELDNSTTISVSSIMNDAQPLIIGGCWSYCGPDKFLNRLNGIMDEVAIWNRALSTEEILRVYYGISPYWAPIIGLSARGLDFYAFEDGSNPPSQILSVQNLGVDTLDWVATEDCPWLDIEPNAGSTTGEPNEIIFSVDISGLNWGLHNCTVTVSDANASNSPQTVQVELRIFRGAIDFGDAPEDGTNYPTTLATWGARHYLDVGNGPTVFLGAMIDEEWDGQPSALADGDDANYMPDEDGVVFRSLLIAGLTADIDVTASCEGRLDAWIDFNADGDWADPCEQIFVSRALNTGSNVLTFQVPLDANPGDTYARFRFSTEGGLSYSGPAPDGEVEDYMVSIVEDCMKPTHPAYNVWLGGTNLVPSAPWSKPDCWCYKYQCRGDADGKPLSPYVPGIHVSLSDLIILRSAIGKMYTAGDWPAGGICADFDMQPMSPYVPTIRVSLADLTILRQHIGVNDDPPGSNIPACDGTHINFWITPP